MPVNLEAVRAAASGNQSLGGAFSQGFDKGQKRADVQADRNTAAQEREFQAKEREYVEGERNRAIKERELMDAEEQYGKTNVPASGVPSLDESKKALVMEWKQSYANATAQHKNGDITAQERADIQGKAVANIESFKEGQSVLTEFVTMYKKGIDANQISDSTPAEIRELGQALISGEGITIQNINGRPTVVGGDIDPETGEPSISMDLGAIGKGTAPLKFNQKVNTTSLTDSIAKALEGYKTTIATSTGAALGNVGWDQIKERAGQDVDEILNSQSTIQAIAADEMGMNSAAIDDAGPEAVKKAVKEYLLGRVQKNYFPIQTESRYKDPNAITSTGGYKPNASLGKFNQANQILADTNNIVDNTINSFNKNTKNFDTKALNSIPGIKSARNYRIGAGMIIKFDDGSTMEYDESRPSAAAELKLKLGIPSDYSSAPQQQAQPAQGGGGGPKLTPAQIAENYKNKKKGKVDPLKRLSPFNRDKEDDLRRLEAAVPEAEVGKVKRSKWDTYVEPVYEGEVGKEISKRNNSFRADWDGGRNDAFTSDNAERFQYGLDDYVRDQSRSVKDGDLKRERKAEKSKKEAIRKAKIYKEKKATEKAIKENKARMANFYKNASREEIARFEADQNAQIRYGQLIDAIRGN